MNDRATLSLPLLERSSANSAGYAHKVRAKGTNSLRRKNGVAQIRLPFVIKPQAHPDLVSLSPDKFFLFLTRQTRK